jgi:hypothetical protein
MTIMTLQPTVYGAYAEADPRRTTFLLSSLQLRLVIAVIAGTTNTDPTANQLLTAAIGAI